MYKDAYHPKIRRDLKKIDRRASDRINDTHINRILADPEIGGLLVGDLSGIRSYHFRVSKQEYRIAYTVSHEERTVFILMIGKREGFYEVLRRRL